MTFIDVRLFYLCTLNKTPLNILYIMLSTIKIIHICLMWIPKETNIWIGCDTIVNNEYLLCDQNVRAVLSLTWD